MCSDQEESLYFGNSFPQPGTQVVSDSSQQDTKQWDSNKRVENAEQLPSLCLRGGVSKTWTWDGSERRELVSHTGEKSETPGRDGHSDQTIRG